MADLVVKDDIVSLVNDLDALVTAFQGATKYQDDCKGLWGQGNANSSMGDFAHNWKINREDMVESMEKLRERLQSIADGWTEVDTEMARSLEPKE